MALVLLCLLWIHCPAAADDGEPEPPPPREQPSYDGRPEPPPTVGDVLLWVPRVTLFPLYVVSEYVVRRPLGLLVSTVEEKEIPQELVQLFTFGPEQRGAIVPTFLIDFGFRPSVGFYLKYDHIAGSPHHIRLRFSTWGPNWLRASITHSIRPEGAAWELGLRLDGAKRPDELFYGTGPRIEDDNRSRYTFERFDQLLFFDAELWRSSRVRTYAGVRAQRFDADEGCCDDPTLAQSIQHGRFDALPAGFREGYFMYHHGVRTALDTRLPRPAPGSGVRLEGFAEHAVDIAHPTARSWVRYGGLLGGYLDVSGFNHVIGLRSTAQFAQAIDGEVPFRELISLSGDGPMEAFVGQRLLGDSGFATTLEYRWPIWVWLDGAFQVAAGNVFDGHLQGIEPERMRLSFSFGFRSNRNRDQAISLLLGVGTTTFADGTDFESFRFVFGTQSTFDPDQRL